MAFTMNATAMSQEFRSVRSLLGAVLESVNYERGDCSEQALEDCVARLRRVAKASRQNGAAFDLAATEAGAA